MKLLKITAIGALIILFASCCACRNNQSKNARSLTDTEWQVVQLEGSNFSPKDDSFTVKFSSDNTVSGKGDCNRVSGGYELPAAGKLTMKGLVSTRAFCPDQASEDKFVRNLDSADSYEIDGDMLMLFSNGQMMMMLKAK